MSDPTRSASMHAQLSAAGQSSSERHVVVQRPPDSSTRTHKRDWQSSLWLQPSANPASPGGRRTAGVLSSPPVQPRIQRTASKTTLRTDLALPWKNPIEVLSRNDGEYRDSRSTVTQK